MVLAFILFFLYEVAVIAALMAIGRRTDRVIVAPGLDIAVSLLIWVPWVLAWVGLGFWGLIGCWLAQLAVMQTFCWWHAKSRGTSGTVIAGTLNRLTSPARNYLALLATLPALPAFLFIRFSQLTTYPILVRTIRLPPYKQSEWVSISRQKFSGLVGHDLIWCLYCDWMTGVYALGGEMLRNLESFWCPIRFYPGKKCDNCKLDFPDIPHWTPADGTLAEVQAKLEEKYTGQKWNSWWGHKDRAATPPSPPTEG